MIRLDSLFGLNLRFFLLDVCAFSWFTAIDSNNENSIKTCTCWHHNYWDRFRKHERTICVMKIHTTWTLYRLSADPDISGGKMSLQQIKHILCLARSPHPKPFFHFDIPPSHTNTFIVINLCSVQWNLCAIRIKCLPFALVYPKNRWKIDFSMAYEVVNHDFL